MLEGIEVLSTFEVVTKTQFNWTAFWIVLAIMIGICAIIGLISALSGSYDWLILPIMILLGVAFGAVIGFLFGKMMETPVEYETQYKVIISEEVPMTEFTEKYEIVDQEGKIFTIRERNLEE